MIPVFCCLNLILLRDMNALEVQGHRGARVVSPENTIPSFEAAIFSGADVLEMDLHVTSDLQCVIHHDFFINKKLCTYQDGSLIEEDLLINQMTLAEIERFDAGGRLNPDFPRQVFTPYTRIPTLQMLFDYLKNAKDPRAQKVRLNLEIKRNPAFLDWTYPPEVLAEVIVNLVEQNGFSGRVYYSSFDPAVLAAVRKKSPRARLGFIFYEKSLRMLDENDLKKALENALQIASSLQVDILSPDYRLLEDLINVGELQSRGFEIIPWTVNTPEKWEELSRLNVNGIITDDPEGLVQWVWNADIRSQEIR